MGSKIIATDHVYPQLNGKKIVIYGGSFSDEEAPGMQPNWVTRMRWMLKDSTIINRAEAGARIAGAPGLGDLAIVNVVTNETITDADIIIVFGGTNDYRLRYELGDFNSISLQNTFCGALYRIGNKLPEIGPKAKVFVVTLPKTSRLGVAEWESGKAYEATNSVVWKKTAMWPSEDTEEKKKVRYYRCKANHTSNDSNAPPDATYWEWIDVQLHPPLVYRSALATWASKNGYTLIDGYNLPLFNPFNDPYGFVQSDGLHYTESYAQYMADYLCTKMCSGGDSAIAADVSEINMLDWLKVQLEEAGSSTALTIAMAYLASDGSVEIRLGGSYSGTQNVQTEVLTLPEHLTPITGGYHAFRLQTGAGSSIAFQPQMCDISNGGVITAQRAPITGTQYFALRATYMTRWGGYNNNQA